MRSNCHRDKLQLSLPSEYMEMTFFLGGGRAERVERVNGCVLLHQINNVKYVMTYHK